MIHEKNSVKKSHATVPLSSSPATTIVVISIIPLLVPGAGQPFAAAVATIAVNISPIPVVTPAPAFVFP